jgi:hypothetical protein
MGSDIPSYSTRNCSLLDDWYPIFSKELKVLLRSLNHIWVVNILEILSLLFAQFPGCIFEGIPN